jgi:hypothetical protein
MMADAYSEYDTNATAFSDIDQLHSLAGGNIWVSEQRTQTPGSTKPFVDIGVKLCCDANCAADESIIFRIARADDAASGEVRDAGIAAAATDDEETDAATIDEIQDVCQIVNVVRIDAANQDIELVFTIEDPGPDWNLLIELDSSAGALDASGNTVTYRYWQPGDGS